MAAVDYFFQNVTTILVALTTLAAYALYRNTRRPEGFPPGPTPLPIIGNLHLFYLAKVRSEVFKRLQDKYGAIYSIRLGNDDTVMLNTIDVVKEALVKKAVEFSGRPKIYSFGLLTDGYKDIALASYGTQWRFQRKLGHLAIRHFAKKEEIEKLVFSVTPKIEKALDKLDGKAFAPKWTIGQVVFNILATLCFAKQYEFNQPELMELINTNLEKEKIMATGIPADYFTVFQYINTPIESKFKRLQKSYFDMLHAELEKHRNTFDPENIRDFIDSLLLAQKEALDTGEEEADRLTDSHLMQTVSDIFLAGTSTTTQTLHWAVALMSEHPDIQEKVAMEIDEFIGRDRLPTLDDRGSLPYTEAAILENFRFGSVAPLGLPHTVMVDTTLCGYKIPKDTVVMINHLALHYDANVWMEPEKFRPERFLNDNGQLFPKPPESLLPFSTGRRVCLGEDFAKKEVFLLFSWLFSRYTFYKVPGNENESLLKMNPAAVFNHNPLDEMEVCVRKRY